MTYRIGADIGGTFTDIVLIDDAGSTFHLGKVLTTPAQPDDAVTQGIDEVLSTTGTAATDISHVVHGTTLFTNALIERKGAKTALITSRGFRDAIEIGREHRYDMYDLYMRRPAPLAPRYLRFELSERLLADGTVRQPVNEDELHEIITQLKSEGVGAVAVCLLHSYINGAHEQLVGARLQAALPDLAVTLSSELVPEIREYERTSTTLANTYIQHIAARYLGRLRERLTQEHGISGDLFIMQSNGGVCEVETAAEHPIRLVESGPAAGALAAAAYGARLGHRDLLSFDMGGTTAKAAVIADGEPLITREFEVDRQYLFKKGSGLPIKILVIDMIEIGTGGGSIAQVDTLQRLQVGPESAGANPGPVCYRLGGTAPTATDADLLLGYLDPDFFLGGELSLDAESAQAAIRHQIAELLGIDVSRAAWGIHQLANENMASAARIHAIERGKDVGKFPIFAFGGAGPVHAFGVARILGSPRVIYPLGAGVMSAVGFLTAPLSFDLVRSFPGGLDNMDWDHVNQLFNEMESEGKAMLNRTIPETDIRFLRYADIRYRKQGYELRVPLPNGPLHAARGSEIRASFEQQYQSIYGHTAPETPVDIIAWRVTACGPNPELTLPQASSAAGNAQAALKGHRPIYAPQVNHFRNAPVYDRYGLQPGMTLAGPAIVEERESTVVVNGPARIQVDEVNNLIVDLKDSASLPADAK